MAISSNTLAKPQGRNRAPFRVLYSNDTVNVVSCVSPEKLDADFESEAEKGEPFRPEMIEASINEAGAADAHMLQPGNGWVPWWKSKVYPADAHYRWFMEKTGLPVDSIGRYMMDGGDLVQVFVNHCRRRRIVPFVSLRMNDYHGSEHADFLVDLIGGGAMPEGYTFGGIHRAAQSRFFLEHPQYRIGVDPAAYINCADRLAYIREMGTRYTLRNVRVLNWAIPEVRQHKFAFIRELCENYDIDGLELDFMRHFRYFRTEETTSEERVKIMTGFVADVRRLLDHTAKATRKRWLCVRVPFRLAAHDPMGIDLRKWVDAGVDMVNLSCHYATDQQCDLPTVCRMIPEAAVYLELTYTNLRYGEPSVHRKMSDEQFYTAAHLAYARGAAGVSFFNFAYYRQIGMTNREPPFHVLQRVKEPAWLARQPQHYFLTSGSNTPPVPNPPFPTGTLTPKSPITFTMDMAPPTGGWQTDGRLRVQGRQPLDECELVVAFNGAECLPSEDISEPYPAPYRDGLGTRETLRAWVVPRNLLKDGLNRIVVQMLQGNATALVFIDLAVK
ncbi:MAG: hypothetical protein AB1696_28700 [Planctomycetota bacterium]